VFRDYITDTFTRIALFVIGPNNLPFDGSGIKRFQQVHQGVVITAITDKDRRVVLEELCKRDTPGIFQPFHAARIILRSEKQIAVDFAY
jgi:uncharacterized protein YggL (DUF469 family)